jgi:hypothetical protein
MNGGECELTEEHVSIHWKPSKVMRVLEKCEAIGGWKLIKLLIAGKL